MPSLSKELRRLLERTIAGTDGARQIAEDGAEQSLKRLAVDRHEPHTSLTPEERTLRNQLRAHGRQLGDKRDLQRGTQTIDHLKQAVAYEHWHRLLFARFLAENDLLMHPEHGVSLTLDEVKELALGKGCDWIELAAEYAQRMLLREVFRSDDPSLRVPLSPEKRRDLEAKLNLLPRDVFLADDSLGWVYQFWQKDAKDEVNRSEVKIGADELAPVTQLFTEDYMVLFLLENTLGAWWTARRGVPDLPGYTWNYLQLNTDGNPVAGGYKGWPRNAKDLKVLDPSMGSGHFLTFALPILALMRAAEENLRLADAITAVLQDNLFGLELDARCSQIAAFNLALTAWKLAGTHFELPPLNLACSGLGINAKEEDWVRLAGEDGRKKNLMRWLYPLFRQAPILGSLIDPKRAANPIDEAELVSVLPLLERALAIKDDSDDAKELAIAARGLLAAARILGNDFTLVATNVPYLGRGKQDAALKEHCDTYFGDSKTDLATCFVERSLRACAPGGSIAFVTPQNWLFLSAYSRLRKKLLDLTQWDFVARLGPHAFETVSGEVVNVALIGLTRLSPSDEHKFTGWDVVNAKSAEEKALLLRHSSIQVSQKNQVSNPDSKIMLEEETIKGRLQDYASSFQGIKTGDDDRFRRGFFEFSAIDSEWRWFQSSVRSTTLYGGMSEVIDWRRDGNDLARKQGLGAWGRVGVMVSHMSNMPVTLYLGTAFDSNASPTVPEDKALVPAIFAYCSSSDFASSVFKLDQSLKPTNSSLVQVPFDVEHWVRVAMERYSGDLPKPQSSDPTHWLFDGHPKDSDQPLQVAVCRLVGYRWPRQTGSSFPDCPTLGPDGLESYVSADGIVCLSSVAGEETAGTRLRALLQSALGEEYNSAQLLAGKRSTTLEGWLRDEFFEDHCQIFRQRPFIWHIWDGLKDGFHALLNYHKLDRRNLEKLIFSYLGDWLTRKRQDVQNGVEGADTRLAAAEHLQSELKQILEGEKPFDIFVRWKPLHKQPIGWDPDLNDGVRMNIRPLITAAKLYKAAKPGLLRMTPNIKYAKDRGQEPPRDPNEFPWFVNSTDRINDHHLSLNEKRRAQGLS